MSRNGQIIKHLKIKSIQYQQHYHSKHQNNHTNGHIKTQIHSDLNIFPHMLVACCDKCFSQQTQKQNNWDIRGYIYPVFIDISAPRQSKKRQQTEPYWVGLSVQYLRPDKRPNGMTRGVFPDTLCYLIKSPGKRRLTIRACT